MTSDNQPSNFPHFLCSKIASPEKYQKQLSSVLLLNRLRQVNALIGFTRVEAPDESTDSHERPPIVLLSRNKPDWIPDEVHGEGIFIKFDEDAVHTWEMQSAVQKRCQKSENLKI